MNSISSVDIGLRLSLPFVLIMILSGCGGGSDSQAVPNNPESPAGAPDNVPAVDSPNPPAPTLQPTTDVSTLGDDPLDYEDIDPNELPLELTPLEPVVNRPVDVSADNNAPFFEDLTDQIIFAGEQLDLLIAPKDIDGEVPGQFIDYVPPGFSYIDNENGTRSLRWLPLQPDVGITPITVTAVDSQAPLLRTSKTIRIQVLLPADQSGIPNLAPELDRLENYVIRAGDSVVLFVRAVDPNGTVGPIVALNPPANATFTPHPEEEEIYILRWSTSLADVGDVNLDFRAVDALDATLIEDGSAYIRIATADEFLVTGPTLRELADARNFKIGYAAAFEWINRPDADLYADTAAQQFNIVTTENSLKWGLVHPEPDEYRWEDTDRLVNFARENNMTMHGHPLVWHRQLPSWVQKLEATDRRNTMLAFIRTVVTRYNNDVAIWDVVNEALEEDGSFRQSSWFNAMGEDYIRLAFDQARRYAPTAQLVYNDYDVAWENPKSDAMYVLLQSLLAEGVPVDGVGFQMHLDADYALFESTARNLQRFADLGLDIYITELDVGIKAGQSTLQQANVYRQVTQLCLSMPSCKAMQTWGYTDRYSWRKDDLPLLFDREYKPKPAFFAIREVLQQP